MKGNSSLSEAEGAVLILSPTQGEGYGAETVLEELLRGWPKSGHALLVAAPCGSRLERVCAETGHPYMALDSSRDAIVPNVRALRRMEPLLPRVSRAHAWSARAFELVSILGARLGVPITGTLHDHPRAAFIGRVRQQIMRHSANRFEALACVSQATRAACLDYGYKSDLRVLYNGLCDFEVPKTDPSARVRLGFLGMRAPRKGFALLERWIPELSTRNIELRLYGEVHPDVQSRVTQLSDAYPGLIVSCGHRPRAEIFAEIDLLLHLSTEFEPFATVLLEAALAGRPSVATRCGGASEALVDGETGILFDPADADKGLAAVFRICADADLRHSLGKQARRRYEAHFRVEVMCEAYADFWNIA